MAVFHVSGPNGEVYEVTAPDNASQAEVIAFARTHAPKPSALKDAVTQYGHGLAEGVSGLSDMVQQASPLGMVGTALKNAANLAALMDSGKAASHVTGAPKVSPNITSAPFSAQQAQATRMAPAPQTTAGRYARTLGQMTPNAIAPGGVARRVANVVLPAVGSETAGGIAEAAGANPFGVGLARTVGAIGGSGLASLNVSNPFAAAKVEQTPEEVTANLFSARAKVDPEDMRQRAQAMSDAGVEPTAVDVVGDKGRRFVRAVGVKSETAGETLADNARSVSSTAKPAIMARTKGLGPNQGTTADQLVEQLFKARDDAATQNYATAYETQVPLDENVIAALQDAPGRAALQRALRAAVARRDDARVSEIQGLLKAGTPMAAPPVPTPRLAGMRSVQNTTSLETPAAEAQVHPMPDSVSGATLDRAQIAFRNQAERLRRNQGGDIAAGLTSRQGDINAALDAVPELAPARADYRAKSQAIDVLGKGRNDLFSTDPGDYGRWLDGLSPEARNANKVAIRQEILDTLGGQRSSTFGSVDELATSEYAKANLRRALGAEADPYIAHLNARLSQVRNARMVDPNAGSRTAVLDNDLQGVMKGVERGAKVAGSALRGDVLGVAHKLGQWFLSRGISEEQSQALAQVAVDPERLPAVLKALEQKLGPQEAQKFIATRNAALIGSGVVASTATEASARERQRPTPPR